MSFQHRIPDLKAISFGIFQRSNNACKDVHTCSRYRPCGEVHLPICHGLESSVSKRTMRALALVTCTSLATSLIMFVQPWRQWQRFGKKALQRYTVTFPKSKECRFHTLSASSLFFVPVCNVPGVSQEGTGQKPVELALFDLPRRADSTLREALHPGTQNANIMHRQRPMA